RGTRPARPYDATSRYNYSGFAMILPFMEQNPIFSSINFNLPITDPTWLAQFALKENIALTVVGPEDAPRRLALLRLLVVERSRRT
ncbi:hypothetical protein, partial [Sphingomonas bacterium]|uniref:hypothetical protein n=1 Tax=Sphingomonas bacterium TaxID=1895847 RepID=UPI001C2D1A11